jgi:phage-related protein
MMCVSHVEAPPLAGYSIGSICSSDLPDVGSSPSGGLSLPKDIQARFQRIFRLIENNGLNALVMPLARHIDGTIWEMRSRGRNGIARGLYVTASCRRVVVLRFFSKKSQNTPLKEIEIAQKRATEVKL